MPAVVPGGLLPEPWQGLLDNAAPLPAKTLTEMLVGRLTVLQKRKDAGEDVEVDHDPQMMFKLEEFMRVNNLLKEQMRQWGMANLRAAAVRLDENTLRVKAITQAGSVLFDEPSEGFPTDEFLTKLRMIA